MTQRIGIITFPGSLDERDAARAVTLTRPDGTVALAERFLASV